ncbi:peptidylprolyl isomerase [Mucilaginibacter robiniae]|uniref:Peptidyl-prolyl cis-trans isomerase n=1 Tax=Mucilaginibacter robiniae TaxID=2728022 RepID=A0A7L5DWP7_9SPHI|nr:FKBP-type peptidyl-prolyl cis-trans isomerase [Mucilaginibacter robiniae]QJD95522.1 peptidylprolyl isomerase [Mucilaginibacter robiniae]
MNKVLIILSLCVCIFAGCKKVDDPAVVNSNQSAIDDQLITDYITANNLTAEKLSPSDTTGIRYIVLQKGTTSSVYTSSTQITVGYSAYKLGSSTSFQQTGTYHPSFALGEVIKGWQLVLQKGVVNKGGTIRIFIPSRYAYGPYAQTELGLPANTVLDFTITIFDVTN